MPSEPDNRKPFPWWQSSLAALAAGILIDAYWLERRRLEVSRYDVPLQHLPFDLDGLKVLQLTDFHLGRYVKPEDICRIMKAAVPLNSDIVVLTGDYVEYHFDCLEAGLAELDALKPRCGIYAVLGNHDYWEGAGRVIRALESRNIRVLINDNIEAAPGLWIAGVDDLMAGTPDLAKTFVSLPESRAAILLSHNPKMLPRAAHRPVLMLSGHTHGGQVGLPLLPQRTLVALPGLKSLMSWYEGRGARAMGAREEGIGTCEYIEGWYEDGEALLYVCRGVGTGAPFRLNCPPEITLFTLKATCEPENGHKRVRQDFPVWLSHPAPAGVAG
ncbi:MAG: metallophosphoesterase [Armatimonadetes bacterium]|nr:metallophosphoesterase [Armatimonadota bacterium]